LRRLRSRCCWRGTGGLDRGLFAIVEASACTSEQDLVTVPKHPFSDYSFVIDEGSVEAAEVSEDEAVTPQLDDAVLFRHDSV
jgi:hypothetical protein